MSKLIIVCGGTGSGKSKLVNSRLLLNDVVLNNGKDNYRPNKNSRSQYIFDINNEYILPTDAGGMKPQTRHISCNAEQFILNAKKIKNTNIVWEDATGYVRGKQQKELIQLVQQRRHSFNNWIFLFHSINRIPPEIFEFSNYVFIFKTGDNLKAIEQKFNNQKLNAAFTQINNPYTKKYTYARIDVQ